MHFLIDFAFSSITRRSPKWTRPNFTTYLAVSHNWNWTWKVWGFSPHKTWGPKLLIAGGFTTLRHICTSYLLIN